MEPNIKRRSGGRSAKSERKAIKSIEQMKWKIPYIGFNRQFQNLKEGYIREFNKVMTAYF